MSALTALVRGPEPRSWQLVVAFLTLGLLPASQGVPTSLSSPAEAAMPAVARAECSEGDRPEAPGALQGQVAPADRVAFDGVSCNLSVLGRFTGPGSTYVGAAHGDCVYYPTVGEGVIVVDASDPEHPRETARLRSPGMLRTWESLKVNAERQLLAGTALGGNAFDLYDISRCWSPRLLSSVGLPDVQGHEGAFAPDGLTYYATSRSHRLLRQFGFLAVDVADPRAPRPLQRWDTPGWGTTHGLSLSPNGRRMYLTVPNGLRGKGSAVAILDVSAVQEREPGGQVRVVSTAGWADGHEAQMTLPLGIGGRPHILVADEKGSVPVSRGPLGCAAGRSAFGYPRILDLSDEQAPRQVAAVPLQVQDPRNCRLVLSDRVHPFSYSSHYCSVDRQVDPRLLACATFGAGVRVFDIRDLTHLREVAYFNPSPRPSARSEHNLSADRGTDWASSPPVFRPDRGELWALFHDNGLVVLRLGEQVRSLLE